jgi:type VI secretion system VasD/TssJ family lipoprotein
VNARLLRVRTLLVLLSIFVGVLGVVACGQTAALPKEPDACTLQIVDMTILASPHINPTEGGDARPVQTRIYQLASDVKLNNADFLDIWKDDKKVFGDDLLKVEEMPIYPDSRTDVRFERNAAALYVAVVSIFRSPKGRSWFTVLELPPPPGKGNCYSKACKDGHCEDAGPELNPKFVIWMDGTTVDTGEDKLEDYPNPGRYTRVLLTPKAPPPVKPTGSGKPGATAPGGPRSAP